MNRQEREAAKRQLDAQIAEAGICNVIRSIHLERMFMMEQRKRAELALGSFLRRQEGWQKDLPEAERKAIAARVAGLINGALDAGRYHNIITSSRAGSEVFVAQEELLTWQLEYVAQKLPVWNSWGKSVRGFGARSLGVIVGEAGDIGSYGDHSRLWKRMGLAVIDGVRQGGLFKTASAEDWLRHGYNPKRRSYMFVIGECLVKSGDIYRQIYLDRKDYERQRAAAQGLTVVPAAKIPKAQKELYMSDGHIHKRAQRYAEKKLLRHLWVAWRLAEGRLPIRDKIIARAAAKDGACVAVPEMA